MFLIRKVLIAAAYSVEQKADEYVDVMDGAVAVVDEAVPLTEEQMKAYAAYEADSKSPDGTAFRALVESQEAWERLVKHAVQKQADQDRE